MSEIAPLVNAAARKKLLFLPHAVRQMSRPDRMIRVQEVRRVVFGERSLRTIRRTRAAIAA